MKILIFSWRDIKNPRAGGSEIYFHEIAKKWVKWGNEVTIICGGWKNCLKEESIDNIKIMRVGNELTLYLLAPLKYLSLKEKPEVIIDVENGIPFFSPLFSNKKIFLHIHHVHKEVWFKEMTIKNMPIAITGYLLETKMMPFLYRKKEVITISKSSADSIIEEGLSKKVKGIVNPGIEFYKYKKMEKSKNPTVLFLNRIKKYKGVDILLKAVNEVKKKNIEDIEFWIAGIGEDLESMKEYTKENDLKNVKFFGRVSEKEKSEIMQKAWIFVNPSFKEGWGIVNIEANYFGTPVLGSGVNGIKDSVINGKTGYLFKYGDYKELADKIVILTKNKKLLENLSKNAKKWSKNFDWDKKSREYLNLIK